ncbi:hypothetical protein HanRHA438_Chr06g0255211 [Helianthus annuus]|nr:hypothetical protein HanIR_Chr06g0264421 [Helianthus annuus]KAJ0910704.1 hypothetical protein HanRHA438_Chr06g0255211 [Helianthus annuus]
MMVARHRKRSGYFQSPVTSSTGFISGSVKIGASMFLSFVVVADNYSPVHRCCELNRRRKMFG